MLKEIFVISQGLLIYHYSSIQADSDSDQAILSSGLLTAIQDFSTHTRSDVLESFATEHEYFVFTQYSDKVIVGVFNRLARRPLAEETLEKVKDILSHTNLPGDDGRQLGAEEKQSIRAEIEVIASQIFGTRQLSEYVGEILSGRTDIPLGFVVDSDEKKILAQFARPKPLFKESYAKEFLLVHSTILRTLSTLGIGDSYGYFKISSAEYVIAVCWSGRLLSVASGSMRAPEDSVIDASVNMCYHSSRDTIVNTEGSKEIVSKAVIQTGGVLVQSDGKPFPPMASVVLSTLANNLSKFFRLLNRREFLEFEITTNTQPPQCLTLRKTDNEIIEIGLVKYS